MRRAGRNDELAAAWQQLPPQRGGTWMLLMFVNAAITVALQPLTAVVLALRVTRRLRTGDPAGSRLLTGLVVANAAHQLARTALWRRLLRELRAAGQAPGAVSQPGEVGNR